MMAKWIDALAESGRKHAKEKLPKKPPPKVERIIITTRPSKPETGDPGSAKIGHFFVEGDTLTLCDEAGTPLRDREEPITAVLEPGTEPRAIAAVLPRRRSTTNSMRGFEKGRLSYPDVGWR
jgi:hypothetical protein